MALNVFYVGTENSSTIPLTASDLASLTTDDLAEGKVNYYFTSARAISAIQNTSPTFSGLTLTGASGIPRFTLGVLGTGSTTTDNLPEGSANQYFTSARVREAFQPGSGYTTGWTQGDMMYMSSATTLGRIPVGTSNSVLTISGGIPTWSTTFHVDALIADHYIQAGTFTYSPIVKVDDGVISTPSYTFISDASTGIYRNASYLGFTFAGSDCLRLSSTVMTIPLTLYFSNLLPLGGALVFSKSGTGAITSAAYHGGATNKFLRGASSTTGAPTFEQPSFVDLSGTANLTTQVSGVLPAINGGTGSNFTGYTFSNLGALMYVSSYTPSVTFGTAPTTNIVGNGVWYADSSSFNTPKCTALNHSTTRKFLEQHSDGTPVFEQVAFTDISGTLSVGSGGTGAGTFTQYGVVCGNGTSALGVTGTGTTKQYLKSGNGAANPSFQTIQFSDVNGTINLTGATQIAGTLQVGSGGTGQTSFTTNCVLIGNGSGAIQVTLPPSSNSVLVSATGGTPQFSSTPTVGSLTLSTTPSKGTQQTLSLYVSYTHTGNSTDGYWDAEGTGTKSNATIYFTQVGKLVNVDIPGSAISVTNGKKLIYHTIPVQFRPARIQTYKLWVDNGAGTMVDGSLLINTDGTITMCIGYGSNFAYTASWYVIPSARNFTETYSTG